MHHLLLLLYHMEEEVGVCWSMKPGGGHSEGVHSRGIGDSSNLQYEGTCDEVACLGIEYNGFV